MRTIIVLLFFFLFVSTNDAQQDKRTTNNLKALKNGTTIFYANEGISFTSQTFNNTFSLKGLKKIFRQYRIKKDDIKGTDDVLSYQNFYVSKNEKLSENLTQYNSYYFVESKKNKVTVFWFGAVNRQEKAFERRHIELILKDSVPKDAFQPMKVDSIDFAGRILKLNSNECQWANINSIQCPYYGQISWSLHPSLEDAKIQSENQLELTKTKKGGKVISEQLVDVEFEGSSTKALKVTYDIKGVNSLLAGISGAKQLTIYYVNTEVRDRYISCVMSFWNNDVKSDSGLAPLLDEIMKLK